MKVFILPLSVLLLVVISLGSSVFAETPTTAPSAQPVVLIAPFQQINGSDNTSRAWVGQALLEDMIATVSRYGTLQPKALDKTLSNTDSTTALKEGQVNNAAVVIYGSYQTVGDLIRISGSVANVNSGHTMGSLQATGSTQDLFRIEDLLGAQLRDVLSRSHDGALPVVAYGPQQGSENPFYYGNQAATETSATPQGALPEIAAQPDSVIPGYSYGYLPSESPIYSQPGYAAAPANYTYPYDYYPYDYAYSGVYPYGYGYPYPYAYGPSIFAGGFIGGGFGDRDHDRGGFRRGVGRFPGNGGTTAGINTAIGSPAFRGGIPFIGGGGRVVRGGGIPFVGGGSGITRSFNGVNEAVGGSRSMGGGSPAFGGGGHGGR
jgi:TolB-like protein